MDAWTLVPLKIKKFELMNAWSLKAKKHLDEWTLGPLQLKF